MTSAVWKRHALRPRPGRGLVITAAFVGSVSIATAIAVSLSIAPGPAMIVLAAPPVTITVAPPAPAPAPPPPPAAEEEEAEQPEAIEVTRPRALAPRLDSACILPADSPTDADEACTWDDGFPALSADGARIAIRHYPDDGGRGNPGLSIRLVDVESSRVVRDAVILSPDEFEAVVADETGVERARLQARIERRVGAIQRTLNAGRFRALALIGTTDSNLSGLPIDTARTHAELSGDAIRIIDPATTSVIWQDRLVIPGPEVPEDEALCMSWELRGMTAWWDPESRTVLAAQVYETGGCMCRSEYLIHVRRI